MLLFLQGLEGYSQDTGFDCNTVRDSGNVSGIRDLTAPKFGNGCRTVNENDIQDFVDRVTGRGNAHGIRGPFLESPDN